jgi:hypothetical protein
MGSEACRVVVEARTSARDDQCSSECSTLSASLSAQDCLETLWNYSPLFALHPSSQLFHSRLSSLYTSETRAAPMIASQLKHGSISNLETTGHRMGYR